MTLRAEAVKPAISVVVPARDAGATITRLLAALGQTTFERPWEVVVVDDASTDATAELAEAWGAGVVRLDRRSGPAAARNAGVAAAGAPLIAFTDADCEPGPGWLSAVHAGLASADLLTGPVLPVAGVAIGPYDRTLTVGRDPWLFETANLSATRELVERVGGFAPFAPAPGKAPGLRPAVEEGHFGEDVVFGWRARRAGARIVFAEDALVRHAVIRRGPRGFIAERWRLRFFPALVREVPELRSRLPLRIFLAERTALFDLAVAALLGSAFTRHGWPALAALPYAKRHLVLRKPWRRPVARHNAVLVAADTVGLVALVRGSLAARRLLL